MVVKKFDAADKTNLTTIETGVYYPNLGKVKPRNCSLK
jgi:hypothetical protein